LPAVPAGEASSLRSEAVVPGETPDGPSQDENCRRPFFAPGAGWHVTRLAWRMYFAIVVACVTPA